MAARRLVSVLIVLLVVAAFAAALAPTREADQGTTDSTTTTSTASIPESAALVTERIPADPAAPAALEASVGDQLRLEVEVDEPIEVRIAELGLSAFATPLTPARFELLLRTPGRFIVTLGDADGGGVAVGRLEVSDAA